MPLEKHKALKPKIKSIARGINPTPGDTNKPSFETADVLLRILTPKNRNLLRLIRDEHPESVADLARLSKRSVPNLLRTLTKLEAVGLIEILSVGRRRKPVSRAHVLRVEIDPFSQNDKFEIA